MKKIFKQSMALFLVLALVFGTLAPVVAWAESETPKVETPVTEGNAPEETPPAEEKQEAAPENAEAPAPENAESEENAAPAQENETEAPADELEISPEEEPTPVGEGEPIQIGSFEELKPYLEVKDIDPIGSESDQVSRLALASGNYQITKDFEIDLADEYFQDKKAQIQFGILSTNENFTFDGGDHTITVKSADASNPSVPLFGVVNTTKFTIENLRVEYPGDVSGFAFAQVLVTYRENAPEPGQGKAMAHGQVQNVKVDVGGSVLPVDVQKTGSWLRNFTGTFRGWVASGFAFHIRSTHLDGIAINIKGDIGSTSRPEEQTAMVAAFGLAFEYKNENYSALNYPESWKNLYDNGNVEVLKDAGHIIDLKINVGGNIQAYGHNAGYSAGVGQDMAEAWMEKIHVRVGGTIETNLEGNNIAMGGSYQFPYASGFSDELMRLKDSSLTAQEIRFIGTNLPASSGQCLLSVTAAKESKGPYVHIENNEVNIGQVKGECKQSLFSSIGFGNNQPSNQIMTNKGNRYTIGDIDLAGNNAMVFNGLGREFRTAKKQVDLGTYKPDPTSLESNIVETGKLSLQSEGQLVANLVMDNASNAKNNKLTYGDIVIKAPTVRFCGLGHLGYDDEDERFYEPVAENNHLKMGDLTIEADNATYISLLAGHQDSRQKMKDCTAKVGKVDITLNSSEASYIGGIASIAQDSIEGCRIFADSVKVENKGSKNLYFGLGAAKAEKQAEIKNSGVFVDGNIELTSHSLYGGGFLGFAQGSTITGNDFQLDGKNDIDLGNGMYGGFAGQITDVKLHENSSLFLNDFMPFVGFATRGSIDRAAHYVNGKAPQYFSGLLGGGRAGNLPTLTNSTLLVEKEFEDTILYRKDSVTDDSEDNYLVVVDTEDEFNRKAYKVEETNSTDEEMGKATPVFKKTGEPIAKINIAKRSFQDKYWTADVVDNYPITDAEKSFAYMTAKDNTGEISVFGVDRNDIVKDGGATGALDDYDHRHAGLRSASGIALDLLGIKGSKKGKEEEPGTPPASTSVIVIVDPNGGMFSDGTTDRKTYTVKIGDTFVLPAAPTREGYKFIAWKTKDGTLYQPGDEYTVKRNGEVFTSQWEEEKKVEPKPAPIPKPQVPPHIAIPVIPKAGVGK